MFRKGDKVVYVKRCYIDDLHLKENCIYIIDDDSIVNYNGMVKLSVSDMYFDIKSFIPLHKYRKQKLKKICSKLEIK